MDERKFSGLVQAIKDWFMPGHVPRWAQTPAETAAESYQRVLPPDVRAGFLDGLIARSADSRSAWDSVSLIAQGALRRGESLPIGLAAWVADVLAERRPRPTKGKNTNANRDHIVTGAVAHVIERFGLTATRNGSRGESCTAEGGSACDVVGAAANMGYKNVESKWLSYAKGINK